MSELAQIAQSDKNFPLPFFIHTSNPVPLGLRLTVLLIASLPWTATAVGSNSLRENAAFTLPPTESCIDRELRH